MQATLVPKLSEKITCREAAVALGEGATLIDVRGFDEFAAGHPRGARCIPLADLEKRVGELPTSEPVLLICQSGGRSAMGAERLRALGMVNIVDVEGGFEAWSKAGLAVDLQRGVIPLERQVRGVAGGMVFVFTLLGVIASRWFLAGSLFVGFMLFLSSVTGFCPMLIMLRKMPWNRAFNSVAPSGGACPL